MGKRHRVGVFAHSLTRSAFGAAKWGFAASTGVALLWLFTVSPAAGVATVVLVATVILAELRTTRALMFAERRIVRALTKDSERERKPQSVAKSAPNSTKTSKAPSDVQHALKLLVNGYASTARPVLERHIARSRPGDAGVNASALALATFDVGCGDFAAGAAWSQTVMLSARTPQEYLAGVLLLADALTFSGRPSDARDVLDLAPEKPGIEWAIRLANTYFTEGEEAAGLAVYNDRWTPTGAQAVRLVPGDAPLIERLRSTDQSRVDGPTVSCLVPAYNAEGTIGYAIRSLRQQTYANLEIVVVDDGSQDGTIAAIESASEGDDRVRVISSSENSGAYVARNTALKAASGDWVRVLDADDWVHPSAIALQVMVASSHPDAPWTWHRGFRCDPSLRAIPNENLAFRRYRRIRDMYSSILYRRIDMGSGWPTWPVGADSAMMRDVKRRLGTGRPIHTHPNLPLSFLLDHPGSLMGAPGQTSSLGLHHPAGLRRLTAAFQNTANAADGGPNHASTNLPERVAQGGREPSVALDVVYAAPFHPLGSQTGVLADEFGMVADSRMTGVLNLPIAADPDFLGLSASTFTALSDRPDVRVVFAGQSITCDVVVVRHAASLKALPDWQATLRTGRVVVVVELSDLGVAQRAEHDGVGARVRAIADGARRLCPGAEVILISTSIDVREQILTSTTHRERGGAHISPVDWPLVVGRGAPEAEDFARRANEPPWVIGRHGDDSASDWPASAAELKAAYPRRPDLEIRMLGKTRTPRRLLGEIPEHWTTTSLSDQSIGDFLRSVDIYVDMRPWDGSLTPRRNIVEALAAALPVLVPVDVAPIYGEAVIGCLPEDVEETLNLLRDNPARLVRQRQQALAYNAWFAHGDFPAILDALAGPRRAASEPFVH